MVRVSRPFDRWFDLSDSYDDLRTPTPSQRKKQAPREWTYAPARPERPEQPEKPTR